MNAHRDVPDVLTAADVADDSEEEEAEVDDIESYFYSYARAYRFCPPPSRSGSLFVASHLQSHLQHTRHTQQGRLTR
jgi:hypothetical protein